MTSWRRPRRSRIADQTDRDLVRHYWPVALRPAFDALLAIDDALAEVVMSSTQPALGAIRLAWWREALARLDASPPPPEPRLQAVAAELIPRSITGKELSGLEQGWATLLDEEPDIELIAERGEQLFDFGARLLGGSHELVAVAGRLYGYNSVFRRGLLPRHWPMEEMHQLSRHRLPRSLRPLTSLAKLAARDAEQSPRIEPEATPGRAAALLFHRIFGNVTSPD